MLEERDEQGTSKVFLLLAGGLVGAGIALLYAPLSGDETRRYLKMQTERATRKARLVSDNLKENVNEIAEAVKVNIDKLVEEGVKLTKEKKAELIAAVEAGRKAMDAERKRLDSLLTEDGNE